MCGQSISVGDRVRIVDRRHDFAGREGTVYQLHGPTPIILVDLDDGAGEMFLASQLELVMDSERRSRPRHDRSGGSAGTARDPQFDE